ncbi:hypothetical protein TrLO_g7733 [Triparma laevis f. longispina]|nr:hypothetical protein TrLO_g7733 [Triparma laevis f. longispina]
MKRCVPSKTEYIPTKFSTNPNPLPRSGSLNLLKLDSTPWFHGVFNSKTFLFTPKYNCCEDCGDGSYTEYYVEYYFTNEKNNKKEKICIGTASVRGGDGMVWDGCIRGDYEEIRTLKSSYSVLTQSFRGWLKKFKITKVEEMDKLGEGVVVNCEVVIDISSFHVEVAALGRRASQRPLADKLAVMMMPRIMAVTLRCNASMAVEVFPKKSFANAMETAAATNWLGMGG